MGADQMELIYTGNEIKEMDRQETKGGTEILSLVEKAGEAIAEQIETNAPRADLHFLWGWQ